MVYGSASQTIYFFQCDRDQLANPAVCVWVGGGWWVLTNHEDMMSYII